MRMNDHLSGARLDQQSAENQAREVAVFLCGTAQSYFESDVKKVLGSDSNASIHKIMNEFALRYLAHDCVAEQLKYMRRDLVKPYDWKPSFFANRLQEVNLCIDFMPDSRTPRRKKLTDDEIKEAYIDAMPQFIREQCKLADFDYENKSLVKLNRYFDLLDYKPQTRTGNNSVPTKSEDKTGDDNKPRASRSDKFCTYCRNSGHTKNECRALKKKQKASNQSTEPKKEVQHMQEFIVDLHVQESEEEVDLDEVLETLDLSTAQGDESTDYIL